MSINAFYTQFDVAFNNSGGEYATNREHVKMFCDDDIMIIIMMI